MKLFLDEIVDELNGEIGDRLAALLTTLHADDSNLFDPSTKAQQLADLFRRPSRIGQEIRQPT